MNKVEILVISNKLDFASDYVCLELKKRNANYLRINRDEFHNYEIAFDVENMAIKVCVSEKEFILSDETLKAIYYRAPIYLRDIYQPNIDINEQLFRTQWTAFIRNLTIYENIRWLNNPISTFKAENKLLQLKYAKEVGFLCPKTIVTNTNKLDINTAKQYIVKSLDTALLRKNGKEAFVYSSVMKGQEIIESSLNISPIIIQDYLHPKIDIRVSVIKEKVYAVKIVQNNQGIDGDWRLQKYNVSYVPIELPKDITNKCIKLVKNLGLIFGGIDLIKSNDNYYFIEINPTGEWAWLVDAANLKIYEGICDFLVSGV